MAPSPGPYPENYLRVRGEYLVLGLIGFCDVELPPRARRIHTRLHRLEGNPGTTSACAENTGIPLDDCTLIWNYLRVRGEY